MHNPEKEDVSESVNLAALIDGGRLTPYHALVVIIASVSIILDGFDSQLMGYAIPTLMKEWGIVREAFVPAVTASFIGMVVGGIITGLMADRFGRKKLLLINLFIFGIATLIIGFTTTVTQIACFRFIAGLGIGGAMPVCATIVAEFAPVRSRALIVTGTIVCTPLGGMVAGYFTGYILPHFGWQTLFFVGGVMPIVLIAIVWALLPETPFYLLKHENRWADLRKLLGRMHIHVADNVSFEKETQKEKKDNKRFSELFKPEFRSDTIALCFVFLFCGYTVYSAFGWLPTMLTAEHVSIESASYSLANYNLGGFLGALVCGYAISKMGSFWPMVVSGIGSWASLLVLSAIDIPTNIGLMTTLLVLHGFFINGIQAPMYALCAYAFPTDIRTTGMSTASSCGRVGAIISGFVGAPVITKFGGVGYLLMLIACMVIVTFGVLAIRKHIPSPRVSRITEFKKEIQKS